MATLSTRELSKQPEKHEPPERARKKNQENEQCVRSIPSTYRTIIADPSCSRGIPKHSSFRGKMCNLSIKYPKWKDNQWCKRTKSLTEFQNGAATENRILLRKPPEMLSIKLNDSSTPQTGQKSRYIIDKLCIWERERKKKCRIATCDGMRWHRAAGQATA